MAIVFIWNEKELRVDEKQIKSFSNWNLKASFVTEEKEVSAKDKPSKTKEKGPGLGELTIDVFLHDALGVNVKDEALWWREACNNGTQSNIYVGDFGAAQLGKYQWMLTDVTQSDLFVLPDGTWRSCKLQLTFQEYYVKVATTKNEKKQAKLEKKLSKQEKKVAKQLEKAAKATSEKKQAKALAKADKLAAKAAVTADKLSAVTLAVAEETAGKYKIKRNSSKEAKQKIKDKRSNIGWWEYQD